MIYLGYICLHLNFNRGVDLYFSGFLYIQKNLNQMENKPRQKVLLPKI